MKRAQVWVERSGPMATQMGGVLQELDVEEKRIVHGMSVSDGCTRLVVETSADPDAYSAALQQADRVLDYRLVPAGEEGSFVFIEQESHPGAVALQDFAEAMGLVVVPPWEFHEDGIRFVIAGEEEAMQRAFEAAPSELQVELERFGEFTGRADPASTLTDRQREAVAVSVDLGYYDVPRTAGVRDVADRLDCAASTASDLLRRAESRVMPTALE